MSPQKNDQYCRHRARKSAQPAPGPALVRVLCLFIPGLLRAPPTHTPINSAFCDFQLGRNSTLKEKLTVLALMPEPGCPNTDSPAVDSLSVCFVVRAAHTYSRVPDSSRSWDWPCSSPATDAWPPWP